jgi:hypothetical protein
MDIDQARKIGAQAFLDGLPVVPALNVGFVEAACASTTPTIDLLKAFNNGWTIAYLAKDSPAEMPSVIEFNRLMTGDQQPAATMTEAARLQWVASLVLGNEVEVAYSSDRDDCVRMTVIKNEGGWLTLETVGKRNDPEHWVKACAVSGRTAQYGFRLMPPGSL